MRKAWLIILVAASACLADQVTYRLSGAFIERGKLEAKLIGLLNKDLANAQANIVDVRLRAEIRKVELQIEGAP